jgi:hypothetical protein
MLRTYVCIYASPRVRGTDISAKTGGRRRSLRQPHTHQKNRRLWVGTTPFSPRRALTGSLPPQTGDCRRLPHDRRTYLRRSFLLYEYRDSPGIYRYISVFYTFIHVIRAIAANAARFFIELGVLPHLFTRTCPNPLVARTHVHVYTRIRLENVRRLRRSPVFGGVSPGRWA